MHPSPWRGTVPKQITPLQIVPSQGKGPLVTNLLRRVWIRYKLLVGGKSYELSIYQFTSVILIKNSSLSMPLRSSRYWPLSKVKARLPSLNPLTYSRLGTNLWWTGELCRPNRALLVFIRYLPCYEERKRLNRHSMLAPNSLPMILGALSLVASSLSMSTKEWWANSVLCGIESKMLHFSPSK